MQRNSENAYNYYAKLLLGLIGVYSTSWFNNYTIISIVSLIVLRELVEKTMGANFIPR